MHLTKSQLRAHHDGESTNPERVSAHMQGCPECRDHFEAIQVRAGSVREHFEALAPTPMDAALPLQAARPKLENRIAQKETNMWQKLINRKYRPAWAALAVVALLALALTFPQVRAVANSFLGLFRVERVTAVQVGISLDDFPQEMEQHFTALDRLLSDQIQVEQRGESQKVQDAAEASALAGFPVRLPNRLESRPQLVFQPSAQVSFEIQRDRWQLLLDEMGYEDFVIPKIADGAQVRLNISNTVNALYGNCEGDEIHQAGETGGRKLNCIILMQSPSPTIEAPPGFDLNRMGQIFLEVLGLSPEEAASFSKNVDWSTTLVVPVPQGADYHEVTVDSVPGIVLEDLNGGGVNQFTLIWVKDGILHALTGDGTASAAVRIANSLK
jgi:hypothetical protein